MQGSLIRFALLSMLSAFPVWAQSKGPTVRLDVPVDCEIGRECLIQKYVDMDGTPGRADHRCGPLTTDGHDGIDIRVRTRADMARGVSVLAAAPGRVLRVRDGEPDTSIRVRGTTNGRDAGNAVIIAHDDGSETQYSHLRQNSVSVKPGDAVRTGDVIGKIGMSGNAEFPHLHFSIRHAGKELDPFSRREAGSGCSAPAGERDGLWSSAAAARLVYQPMALVTLGVANTVPSASTGDRVEVPESFLAASDPMILWAEVIGARPGDRQRLRILAPGGNVILDQVSILDKGGLSWFAYSGRKPPAGGWAKGQYRGEYGLSREGLLPVEGKIQFTVR